MSAPVLAGRRPCGDLVSVCLVENDPGYVNAVPGDGPR